MAGAAPVNTIHDRGGVGGDVGGVVVDHFDERERRAVRLVEGDQRRHVGAWKQEDDGAGG